MDLEKLKYPIGKYIKPSVIDQSIIDGYIFEIESFPERLRNVVSRLSQTQLDTAYRPDGWTARQVIHHCADSHINSFIRFKLALTEDKPTIKPYFEERWAELADAKNLDIEPSLMLLEGLHKRWVVLLKSFNAEDFQKVFIHPEHGKSFTLAENTGIYAWHCNHHLAHVLLVDI
jgi:hypothetical protein